MMEDKVEHLKSSKGKPIVAVNGYLYLFETSGVCKFIWRCVKYHSKTGLKCPARLHTSESFSNANIINHLGSHNHEPCPSLRDVKKVVGKIKEVAVTTTDTPSHIIAEMLQDMPSS